MCFHFTTWDDPNQLLRQSIRLKIKETLNDWLQDHKDFVDVVECCRIHEILSQLRDVGWSRVTNCDKKFHIVHCDIFSLGRQRKAKTDGEPVKEFSNRSPNLRRWVAWKFHIEEIFLDSRKVQFGANFWDICWKSWKFDSCKFKLHKFTILESVVQFYRSNIIWISFTKITLSFQTKPNKNFCNYIWHHLWPHTYAIQPR